MKEVFKEKCAFTGKIIIYTVDPKLDKLMGKVHAPEKLARANEFLRSVKVLPTDLDKK